MTNPDTSTENVEAIARHIADEGLPKTADVIMALVAERDAATARADALEADLQFMVRNRNNWMDSATSRHARICALEAEVQRLREAVEARCASLIAEAQSNIDANRLDIMPSKTVEDLWLGRRIGVESALAAIRADLTPPAPEEPRT
ncbi:hypothetical protein [Salipiger marinus]|uniref:hypothetical protein n=1 Tax=Salipiger marinus TaxID=555512 RepID=UPI004057EA35